MYVSRHAGCKLEPPPAAGNSRDALQLGRQGYFCHDRASKPGRPCSTAPLGVHDTWAKVNAGIAA